MTYGFIGLGNMASAILRGMAKAGVFAENALVGYNPSAAKVQALQAEMPSVAANCPSVGRPSRWMTSAEKASVALRLPVFSRSVWNIFL